MLKYCVFKLRIDILKSIKILIIPYIPASKSLKSNNQYLRRKSCIPIVGLSNLKVSNFIVRISIHQITIYYQDHRFYSICINEPWVLHQHFWPFYLGGLLIYRVYRGICNINAVLAFLMLKTVYFV